MAANWRWTESWTPEAKAYVYGLHEGDGIIRYVGGTKNIKQRMQGHHAVTGSLNPAARRWLIRLRVEHRRVQHVILEETTIRDLAEREVYWIRRIRREGHPILNAHDT